MQRHLAWFTVIYVGKMSVKSIGGAEYFLTFIDDSSRHNFWVYFLKTKDEVFQKFQEWKSVIEKNLG